MTIRTILTVVDGGPGSDAAVRAALAAGGRFGAHVEMLHVRAEPENMVPMIGEGMSGVMVEQMLEGLRKDAVERAQAARRLYETICVGGGWRASAGEPEATGASVSFRESTGREEEVAAKAGRLFDLIVLARPEGQTGSPSSVTLETALLDSGRPVLVASTKPADNIGKRILIAWNGKVQGARAVAAALPWLAKAEVVTVATVVEAHTPGRPEDLVRYLAWHGIRATPDAVPVSGAGKVGAALIEACGRAGADLLVMGAYGHSRLREMILGGATREVLAGAPIPLLMVH